MFEQEFQEISKLFKGKTKILLATHQRPDGDAIGSMIGLFSALFESGDKELTMFSRDSIPDNFKFLPYRERVVMEIPAGFAPDIFVGLDYGDFERLGIDEDLIKGAIIITFDHHPLNKQKGDIMVIDPSLSSTCELVYNFLVYEGSFISSRTAKALLTGIFTDTGGFAHINTSVKTLTVAADLLNRGIYTKNLHKHTFANKSSSCIKAWGHMLQKICYDENLGMCYAGIDFDAFEQLGASLDDFEGVVNVMNMPPEASFSLLLIEYKPQVIKGSMRSEPFKKGISGENSAGGVDVAAIARELGGGGHRYAAGFEITGEPLENAVEYVKKIAIGCAPRSLDGGGTFDLH